LPSRDDPFKRWKLSPVDLAARKHCEDYTRAREAMLAATHTTAAPWTLVDFNDQRRGRLTLVRNLLDRLPDTRVDVAPLDLPPIRAHKERFGLIDPIHTLQGAPRRRGLSFSGRILFRDTLAFSGYTGHPAIMETNAVPLTFG
jgi:hypothetical protein